MKRPKKEQACAWKKIFTKYNFGEILIPPSEYT